MTMTLMASDDVILGYLDGLFQTCSAKAEERPYSTISREHSLLPLMNGNKSRAEAMVAALFLLPLAGGLEQGRLRDMILAHGLGYLERANGKVSDARGQNSG